MSPGRIESPNTFIKDFPADKSIFPDGFKTSGQNEPVYSVIQPYDNFPKQITGQTVWTADEYKNNTEKWTYIFSDEEVAEIEAAADKFIADDVPLIGITKDLFPLPKLAARMRTLRDTLLNGQGFWLFKGLPVSKWGNQRSATAYMGLGTHLGYFTSQNGRGHALGHVKDLGEDATQTDRVRIYRTSARQYFHTDATDLVGLLCMARSKSGGESDIASMHNVWNCLQKEHPEAAELLTKPIWYTDRKGEVSHGQDPWIRVSIFYLEHDPSPGASSTPRLYGKFDPMNFISLKRFQEGENPQIPPLTSEQRRAMDILEETCMRESLHMILSPGDIQFLSNAHIFHARTAYQDWAPGTVDDNGNERQRRHLMRLWLSVPQDEGGWKLPYVDAHNKKRGGVQVNETPPVCPLDAE